MSTRSHDKTVETADNPVYVLLLFFFFFLLFCKQDFLCVFKRVLTQQYQVSIVCAAGFFFLRDHRRTSPFSNWFKILLDFGSELLLFTNCFISECFFFVCVLISEIPPPSLSFKAEIPIFHMTPTTHTHTHTHFHTLYSTAGSYLPV